MNSSKTKCMLIAWKHSQALHLPPLNLNGSMIQPVEHYKYLGVWISSDLTWTKHVESVSCKAQRLLGFMFRQEHIEPARWAPGLELSLPSKSLKLSSPSISYKFYLLLTTHVWFGTHIRRKINICWSLSRHLH